MDTETKKEFTVLTEQLQQLTLAVTEGFSKITNETHSEFVKFGAQIATKADFAEFKEEIRSIRAEMERVPSDIDQTYSATINDLLERLKTTEMRLAKLESAQ